MGLENWKQWLHELSTRRCVRMTHTLTWVGTKVREPTTFYGLNDLEDFLMKYEEEVMENKILLTLDIALKDTPAIWWGTHKENIGNWFQCKRLLHIRLNAK
jgi:hypothetical protein